MASFCDSSQGFRPGRSCHRALAQPGKVIATKKVNWIPDADIKGFFDNVCHTQLCELLRKRLGDPKMLQLIERFLKAGVMIEGRREDTDDGVPQGSVLSPLLANVYLHYVLDSWFEHDMKPRLRGEASLVRYADDFICAFECESDAWCFQDLLVQRLRSRLTVPLREVWPLVNARLAGHFQYDNVNDNWASLELFRRHVSRLCFRWMRRRSQKGKTLSWRNFYDFLSVHPPASPKQITDLIAMAL